MKIITLVVLFGLITLSALTTGFSTIYAQVQQQAPSQNMTGGISTNNNTTPLSSNPNAAQARITELEQQDPAFAYYRNSTADCWKNFGFNVTATEKASAPSTIECSMTYQTAFDDYCSAGTTFHAEKCEIVKNDMDTNRVIQDATNFLSSLEYGDGTPYLGPDGTVNEPPVFPPPVSPPAGGNEVSEPQQQEMRPQTYTIQIWTYEHSDNIEENEFRPVGPDMMRNSSVVQVKVGDTIKWRNDNRGIEHTVTSGENGRPDGRFDSGVISYTEEFKHTFTEAGEYPYFCLLHPNMVGTVLVTAAGSSPAATSSATNSTTISSSAIANNNNNTGPLSTITDPLQNLFGGGDHTTGNSDSSATNTGSSTFSSSPSTSSSGSSSRCPDGYHRSPSGDCERVTDTRGMPRCPDGYHRSPSGNCEYVG